MKEQINGGLEVDNLTHRPSCTGSPDVLSTNFHPKASHYSKLPKLVEVASLCLCASIIVADNFFFLVVCRIVEDKVVFSEIV